MANTKSAQKAMRQGERRATRNQSARAAVRTYVKKASEAVAAPGDGVAEVVRAAVSALDKAAHKGIVHPNAAARRKSRLMSRLHRLSVAPVEEPAAVAAPAAKGRGTTIRATAGRRPAAAKSPSAEQKPPLARKPVVRKAPAAKD